ncbi:hypothetical protein GCM10009107_02640 [Ideonella azotifigens]|uniref:Uncharacterized protein n=1 Tax=Ideonella azotifigens TaxID=513160 RepID=A0ABN1JIS4_9BURK
MATAVRPKRRVGEKKRIECLLPKKALGWGVPAFRLVHGLLKRKGGGGCRRVAKRDGRHAQALEWAGGAVNVTA